MTPPVPTARQRVRHSGTITAERIDSARGEATAQHATNEKVPAVTEHPTPAYVTVGGGVTIPLRQYESIRCEVRISMPCDPNWQAADETYRQCTEFVDAKIKQEIELAAGDALPTTGVTAE